ncbi:trypsin-like peptidase domain-containing protein [Streptomyces sp. MJP52]|uniref:S1C family serine protease n=1 Tax=Streptomyces sp. MJP52 TaxID=2940555 RepID=UPI002475EE40|nr:trypsin-like peptidase domain-containing protein [Streptomyces sp. MJP52]MDH6225132.1 putative serine protease PepD [Streptomyces sp. MJP52]
MDEGTPGKSARPRWWSRPRPVPGPDASGDFPLAAPEPAAEGPGTPPGGRQDVPVAPATSAAPAPRPPHGPDHYSTPPYGTPGPWAPAPPVQHPAAPAAGHVPPQPGAPAPDAPVPEASPATASAVPEAPAVPPVPGAFPAPAAEAPGAGAPAHPATAHRAAPDAWQPPAAEALVPAAPDAGAPAPAAPGSGGLTAHGTAGPDHASDAAGGQPPGTGGDPVSDDPTGPWGRYDPWAAPGTAPAPAAALPPRGGGPAAESPSRRRGGRRRALVGGAAAVALVAGLGGGVAGAYLERHGGLGVVELSQAPRGDAPRDPDSVAGIAERALPSVVTLHVQGSGKAGTGTGFVLDERGHILTNHHVVQAAEDSGDGRIVVTFSGGETARAELVGGDAGYDLAVVRVKGVKGLSPMPLGNSDDVRVGDPVVAIGAPFDLSNTVTAGIISAKERPITAGGEGDGGDVSYVDALQTDAPINPGNSGGPLLDTRGRVIGINSAIRSADTGIGADDGKSGSIGLGFAIPVNQAKRVAEELINEGEATHPVIGVTLDMAYPGDGARVHTRGAGGGSPVTPGGPGAEAGLKPGDVITAVDGVRVHSGDELIAKTRARQPGDRLELTVERGGEEREVTLVLGSSDD